MSRFTGRRAGIPTNKRGVTIFRIIHDYPVWAKEKGFDQHDCLRNFMDKYGIQLYGDYYTYKNDLFSMSQESIEYIDYNFNAIKESFVTRYALTVRSSWIRDWIVATSIVEVAFS